MGIALAQVVSSDRLLSGRPHWSPRCGTIGLVPDSYTPAPGPVTLLPIQAGTLFPSVWPADRLLKGLGGRAFD
jgi:hypothetical protein